MDLLHAPQAKVSLSSADPLWKLGQITAIPKPGKRWAAPTWAPEWVVLKGEEGRCFTNSGRSVLGKDIVIKNIPREKWLLQVPVLKLEMIAQMKTSASCSGVLNLLGVGPPWWEDTFSNFLCNLAFLICNLGAQGNHCFQKSHIPAPSPPRYACTWQTEMPNQSLRDSPGILVLALHMTNLVDPVISRAQPGVIPEHKSRSKPWAH